MKRIARYQLNFDSRWMTISGLLMGLCLFMQAVYFLGIRQLLGLEFSMLVLYLIGPMALEFAWLVFLRGTKLDAVGMYAFLGIVMLGLFLVQACFFGGAWDIVSTACYLLFGGAALVFITAGYFPYRLIGQLAFAGIFCIRLFVFDLDVYIVTKDWAGLVLEAPTLCMMAAVTCFFGGIRGERI